MYFINAGQSITYEFIKNTQYDIFDWDVCDYREVLLMRGTTFDNAAISQHENGVSTYDSTAEKHKLTI